MSRRIDQDELLRLIGDDGSFVSGEQLSRQLGVSRTAVWKQITAMRSAGFSIDALPSHGYRLVSSPEKICMNDISAGLPAGSLIGQQVVWLSETGSTNAEAFRLAEQGATEGTVVMADRQTAGKGRLGRQWVSPGGVNLYLSVILRPPLPPYEAPQLTFLSAVAVARAIEDETGLKPAIKWPNDLRLNGRKVAGLLNEMSAETDRIGFVILGIGLNLNMGAEQFPPDLRSPATSLAIELDRPVSRKVVATRLLAALDDEYARFGRSGFGPVRESWSKRCNAYGRQVMVDHGGVMLKGPFAGIDHDGALLLLFIR